VHTVSYIYAPLFEGNALQLAVKKRIPLILAGYSPGYPNPVRMEYVARGIDWASGHAEVADRILHLGSGPEDAIKIPVLMQHVRAFMRTRGTKWPHLYPVPRVCFHALLPVVARLTSPKVRRALGTLPLFLGYLDQPPMFSNAKTKQLLTSAGITVPPVHTSLETILRYYDQARADSAGSAAVSTEV
jgi:hypothetical protein